MPKAPKSQPEPNPESQPSRLETVLAYMGVGVIGLSVLSIVISLFSAYSGNGQQIAVWAQIPMIGLPLGMLLIIALVVVSIRRRKNS